MNEKEVSRVFHDRDGKAGSEMAKRRNVEAGGTWARRFRELGFAT